MKVARRVLEQLIDEAKQAYPRECCGILLGMGEHVAAAKPTANVHPDPETHFEIDPQALIDAHREARRGGPDVLGYYHSHPNGLACPSATDRSSASGDGKIWAIIADGRATFWRDGQDGFEEIEHSIVTL